MSLGHLQPPPSPSGMGSKECASLSTMAHLPCHCFRKEARETAKGQGLLLILSWLTPGPESIRGFFATGSLGASQGKESFWSDGCATLERSDGCGGRKRADTPLLALFLGGTIRGLTRGRGRLT